MLAAMKNEYLGHAERCEAMARECPDAFCKRALEEVAFGWRKLAAEVGGSRGYALPTADALSARIAA